MQKVAIITGGSQGIGAGLVAGYRRQGWAVVANARTITPSQDPEVATVDQLPPMGRVGQISDIVDGILFLEASPYITGEILHIDGGLTAGH